MVYFHTKYIVMIILPKLKYTPKMVQDILTFTSILIYITKSKENIVQIYTHHSQKAEVLWCPHSSNIVKEHCKLCQVYAIW